TRAADGEIVVRDVAVIDVLSGEVRAKHDVRVRDGRIVAVAPTSSQPPSPARLRSTATPRRIRRPPSARCASTQAPASIS
ncbi:MAG: hypothetical protein ACRETX_15920, partial [Steroidobacteraceae bacterium]